MTKYRGKYPTAIKSVYSLRGKKGVVGVTLNNGVAYTLTAKENNHQMPETGHDISEYKAVRVPAVRFGYWSYSDGDGTRFFDTEKPDYWDRGFMPNEVNADAIGYAAQYPEDMPRTDPDSAENFGPVTDTLEEAIPAMLASWEENRKDYVASAKAGARRPVFKRDPLAGVYGSESQDATATVTRSDLETVAACAAEVMQHPQHNAFYERFADDMGGFTGFYQAAIDLAAPINTAAKGEKFFFDTVPFFDLIDRITDEYITQSLEAGKRVKDFGALFAGVHAALKAEDEAATARVRSFQKPATGAAV